MVHYVDVHLPWSHSLCACCLPRMLRPAPPIAFQMSLLTSLRKHLQQPYVSNMPPYRFGHKPPRFITAYSAIVPLSAPPLRPPGSVTGASAAAEESVAAPTLAQQYWRKVDSAPVVAAEGMMLKWLAEPRVGLLLDLQNLRRQLAALLHMNEIAAARVATEATGNSAAGSARLWWCCWQCSHCWTRYRRAVSIAAFTVLVAKLPRFTGGDCLASLLLQVLGVKGKEQLETGFAAHLLLLLPGGRHVHGQAGGAGESWGTEVGEVKEWREGLGGVEWEEYVQRVGEIVAQGGLAGEHSTLFCQPPFARAAALIFSDCVGSRHKERVEDAAVEEARNRLEVGEKGIAISAATAAGSTGARTKGPGTASGARLVLVNSNAVVGLFTYRVTCLLRWVRFYGFRVNPMEHCACSDRKKPGVALPHPLHDLPNLLQRFGAAPKPPTATGSEGSAMAGWEEFPEGDRAAVAAHEKDPGEFMGIKTFQLPVGPPPFASLLLVGPPPVAPHLHFYPHSPFPAAEQVQQRSRAAVQQRSRAAE
ncbi:unnamed protein product [Closterium sp. Naga37s-1]|nr:unnamed protein product [Closterium sp. Naga37s-1]